MNNLDGNKTVNFVASTVTYTISGYVTNSGSGLGGVAILVNQQQLTTTLSPTGFYSVSLAATGSYTLVPQHPGGSYVFSPGSFTFNNLSANQTQNFTSAPIPTGIFVYPNAGSWPEEAFHFWMTPLSATTVEMLFKTTLDNSTANACYIWYLRQGFALLGNDTGTGSVLPAQTYLPVYFPPPSSPLHGSALASNSQCMLDFYNSYHGFVNPNEWHWVLPIYFRGNFVGGKGFWVRSDSGPWLPIGNWYVPTSVAQEPTATIQTPTGAVPVSGAVAITGTVTDSNTAISSVKVYVDGQLAGTASVNGSSFSFSWPSTSVANGQRIIKVVAIDTDNPRWLKTAVERVVTVSN